ncbi:TetR/AcrR family transcriptional regulator [Alkalihalobacterium chitinilyticum]|uniref:TetR/AcrR family transcriptional regulator n=1 Tax=Alkalihalobacterium chitinilyticum TaxID=2980103 RepID=A0ABT5VHJ1_9BACI|nr:TetR/AcrR family transcriptional regulator [Alkalihalobacterium chitinilyticum]MDE5414923.1 TetR/AcrR family transcriptional regulator [Alkalihalobacterium chitinilyticum]
MTKLTPRKIKALETKKKILNTALDLFSKNGYNNVTIDDIAKDSGTSKGAFYNHFNSKYEIFLEKFKEIDDFYINFLRELENEQTEEVKIKKLIHAQLHFLEEQLGKEVIRTIYINALHPNQSDFLVSTARPYYRIVKTFIEAGQETGEFRTDMNAERLTNYVTRCTRGTLYDWGLYDNFNLVEEGTTFLELIIEGIKTERH